MRGISPIVVDGMPKPPFLGAVQYNNRKFDATITTEDRERQRKIKCLKENISSLPQIHNVENKRSYSTKQQLEVDIKTCPSISLSTGNSFIHMLHKRTKLESRY